MNSVQNIYNAAKASDVGNVRQIGEGSGTGDLKDKKVAVLKTDRQEVCTVREQLVKALKGEVGKNNAGTLAVQEIGKRLLGEDGSSPLRQKPLSSRQIKSVIVSAWATKVDDVLSGTLKVAKFPSDAKKLLRRVLMECAGHPDVEAFLDGSAQTPKEKLDALCRVCALASQLGKSEETLGKAYLAGFSAGTKLTVAYDGSVHTTEAILAEVTVSLEDAVETVLESVRATVAEAILAEIPKDVSEKPSQQQIDQLKAFAKKTVDALHAGKKESWPGDIKAVSGYAEALGQEAMKEARSKWTGFQDAQVAKPVIQPNDVKKPTEENVQEQKADQKQKKKAPEAKAMTIAYGKEDEDLSKIFGCVDREIAETWKNLAECDKAWAKRIEEGLGEKLRLPENDPERISAENERTTHVAKRDQLYLAAQMAISSMADLFNDSLDLNTMAAKGSPTLELVNRFEEFVEEWARQSVDVISEQYKRDLVAAFKKMPPSVLNIFANKGVESHEKEVFQIVQKFVKGEQHVPLPTEPKNSESVDKILPALLTNDNQSQEENGTTLHKWGTENIEIGVPNSAFKPKITHLLNNASDGDCFFYSVLNGLNDVERKKYMPTEENAGVLRTMLKNHITELLNKAQSGNAKERPVGFRVKEDTWSVASGKTFVDVKAARDEYRGEVPGEQGRDIGTPKYMADNAQAAFIADLLQRPVVILSQKKNNAGVICYDRDLTSGRPLTGQPIYLYYVGLHYQTARVDEETKAYIEERLNDNTK